MSLIFRLTAIAAVACAAPGPALAQTDPEALARRIAAASSIAADEYALGVDRGRIISQAELTEARLFLGEAREASRGLPEPVRSDAMARLERLLDQARRLDDPGQIRVAVEELRRALAEGLSVHLDPLPSGPPSLDAGAKVYRESCAACHGDRGTGDGPAARDLHPPPANLADAAALRGSSPLDFFRKISFGVAGTAMTGYESRLTLEQRWAVALYASSLRSADTNRRDGAAWVSAHCPRCPPVISDFSELAGTSDDSLAALLTRLSGAAPPPAAVGYARNAAAAEELGSDRGLAIQRVVGRVGAMIDQVESRSRAGDREGAQSLALEAYLEFEGIEREVGARSASAMAAVERTFAELRAAAGSGREVSRRAAEARHALDRAARAGAPQGPVMLATQSFLIIVREGLEAILIVAALMAFLVRSGARERVRELGIGAGLGIGASLLTAVAFATVLRVSAAQQEVLEGLTMLLASVVLFWVASWMVSRIEADKWRAFVQARMRRALSSGGAFALGGVAFLAVYREGVETALFYAALLGNADGAGGPVSVLAGLLAGAAVLVLVYLAIQRWGIRLPLKPFFAATGILLTVMAVSFAGQGVAELQAAGWIPATPVALPAIPVLGIFPTFQTLLAQLLLAAAFAGALCWIFWLGPRAAARRAEA
jgi:high-affinity iron transporter